MPFLGWTITLVVSLLMVESFDVRNPPEKDDDKFKFATGLLLKSKNETQEHLNSEDFDAVQDSADNSHPVYPFQDLFPSDAGENHTEISDSGGLADTNPCIYCIGDNSVCCADFCLRQQGCCGNCCYDSATLTCPYMDLNGWSLNLVAVSGLCSPTYGVMVMDRLNGTPSKPKLEQQDDSFLSIRSELPVTDYVLNMVFENIIVYQSILREHSVRYWVAFLDAPPNAEPKTTEELWTLFKTSRRYFSPPSSSLRGITCSDNTKTYEDFHTPIYLTVLGDKIFLRRSDDRVSGWTSMVCGRGADSRCEHLGCTEQDLVGIINGSCVYRQEVEGVIFYFAENDPKSPFKCSNTNNLAGCFNFSLEHVVLENLSDVAQATECVMLRGTSSLHNIRYLRNDMAKYVIDEKALTRPMSITFEVTGPKTGWRRLLRKTLTHFISLTIKNEYETNTPEWKHCSDPGHSPCLVICSYFKDGIPDNATRLECQGILVSQVNTLFQETSGCALTPFSLHKVKKSQPNTCQVKSFSMTLVMTLFLTMLFWVY